MKKVKTIKSLASQLDAKNKNFKHNNIFGGAGNDILVGGAGSDTYIITRPSTTTIPTGSTNMQIFVK